ncbi:glycosyltransferase family 4 protein, partial [Roseovarius sp.]|uniref:glycosyltransferase family 4 protein n=1 Tax=Roseovarius sp. TaxID=1486281 RepID=UPI003564B352
HLPMTLLTITHFTRRPAPGAFSIERVFFDVRAALPPHITVRVVQNAHLSRGVLPRLRDAWTARRCQSQVNHIVGDVHYLAIFLPKTRTVLTVHDTLFVERERGLKRFLLWLFWLWLPMRRSARITAISEESRRRLLRLVAVDPAKIEVIPNPVAPGFSHSPMPERAGPFRLLHLGTKANKNLERLLPALEGLKVELTIIGRPTPAQQVLLNRHLPYCHRLRVDLDDAELQAEYARAEAVVFLSLSEGFGLPILEAQAKGRPLLTSERAPMNDVAGNAALLVDPEDGVAIRKAVVRLTEDADLRADLVAKGTVNLRRFSADTVAARYAKLYETVVREAQANV